MLKRSVRNGSAVGMISPDIARKIKASWLITIVLLFSSFAMADIINVPADQLTIQAGIDSASNGDTVLVQPGNYVEIINFNGKNITVGSLFLTTQDTTYISQTIIDGNQNPHVVRFSTGEGSTAILTGFTVTNGDASGSNPNDRGAGIYCSGSSPSLTNIMISGNTAINKGGGIYCWHSNPILTDVTVSGDTADEGGGIYLYESAPSLTNVTISGNSAGDGGGIYFYESSPGLTDVAISGNSADNGGGIYCWHSNPNLTDVTISGDTADEGGGIYCYYSSPSLTNVSISENTASGDYGGGIYCYYSSPSLTNVTITGNTSGWWGGGIMSSRSNPILTDVTISGNSAGYGGGINGFVNFTNGTISGNSAGWGGGVYCNWGSNSNLTNVTVTGNNAGEGGGFYFYSASPTLTNVIITGNNANDGGGIYSYTSRPSLTNVTITGNNANNYGSAVYCSPTGMWRPSIVNSIVSDNTGNYAIYNAEYSYLPSISYSDFWNNEGGNFYNCEPSVGVIVTTNVNGDSCDIYYNIQLEPLFADPGNEDFHLTEDSPCIDAGTPDTTGLNLPPWDLDGNPRIYNGIIDMGAYEWQGVSTGDIGGTVTDAATGNSIAGAIVRAYGIYAYCDTTDIDGYYCMLEVFPDTYDITVTALGYNQFDTTGIVVLPGETTVVDIPMLHPEMVVEPASFELELPVDTTYDTTMTISNPGNGPLDFEISIVGDCKLIKSIEFTPHGISNIPPGRPVTAAADSISDTKIGDFCDKFARSLSSERPLRGTQTESTILSRDEAIIHYDGENYDYIGLFYGGIIEGAIRLTPEELGPYNGWDLTSVRFYHGTGSSTGMLKIYGQGASSYPGSLISSEPCSVSEEGWLTIDLSSPVTINASQDIWVSRTASHAAGTFPLGIDAGPAVAGKGDWVYDDGVWIEMYLPPYFDFNWNIRAIVTSQGESEWLSVTPDSGSVPASQSLDVTLHFDTYGLTPDSTYTASILIHNNSTDSLVDIPVTLHTVTVGVEETASIPKVFALAQSYPNPFRERTVISYSLPGNAKGTIYDLRFTIYDLSGRAVKTLVDDTQKPGYYSVTWDGCDDNGKKLTSGIYFYRLEAGDYVKTNKLVLLR